MGVGIGTAGGAAAGATVGAVGGPIGSAVGAVVGGVAGAFAGKGVAETIDPTVEEAYWRENHDSQEWATDDTTYEDYEPAYRMGYERRAELGDSRYEDHEANFEKDWVASKGDSSLTWEKAQRATRAGWHRIDEDAAADQRSHKK